MNPAPRPQSVTKTNSISSKAAQSERDVFLPVRVEADILQKFGAIGLCLALVLTLLVGLVSMGNIPFFVYVFGAGYALLYVGTTFGFRLEATQSGITQTWYWRTHFVPWESVAWYTVKQHSNSLLWRSGYTPVQDTVLWGSNNAPVLRSRHPVVPPGEEFVQDWARFWRMVQHHIDARQATALASKERLLVSAQGVLQ